MEKIYQVTLYATKYRPVSALVKRKPGMTKEDIRTEGIKKICLKRYWGTKELKSYGYTTCKMRLYEPPQKEV